MRGTVTFAGRFHFGPAARPRSVTGALPASRSPGSSLLSLRIPLYTSAWRTSYSIHFRFPRTGPESDFEIFRGTADETSLPSSFYSEFRSRLTYFVKCTVLDCYVIRSHTVRLYKAPELHIEVRNFHIGKSIREFYHTGLTTCFDLRFSCKYISRFVSTFFSQNVFPSREILLVS